MGVGEGVSTLAAGNVTGDAWRGGRGGIAVILAAVAVAGLRVSHGRRLFSAPEVSSSAVQPTLTCLSLSLVLDYGQQLMPCFQSNKRVGISRDGRGTGVRDLCTTTTTASKQQIEYRCTPLSRTRLTSLSGVVALPTHFQPHPQTQTQTARAFQGLPSRCIHVPDMDPIFH